MWVADAETGKRKLTKDEEIDRLNNAYNPEIEWQTMVMDSRKETEKAKNITFSVNQPNTDNQNNTSDSDKLSKFMNDIKDKYLLSREDRNYDKNIQGVSGIVSAVLDGLVFENRMVNIIHGVMG